MRKFQTIPVGDEDVGCGPARVIDPAGVAALNDALIGSSEADFNRQFEPSIFLSADIYPQIWDEPIEALKEEYDLYLSRDKDSCTMGITSWTGNSRCYSVELPN